MEKELKQQIEEIINVKIRPKTRVDGGDIKLNRIEDSAIYVDAFADCAVCQCCEPELKGWIAKQLKKNLGMEFEIHIIKNKPYYY